MKKPFYFRLEPSQLLTALIQIPESERGVWITQVAIELASGLPVNDFAQSLFNESRAFQEKASERSRIAGLASAFKRQQKSTLVQRPSTSVRRTSTPANPEAVAVTKTKIPFADNVLLEQSEYEKLTLLHGEPFVKKCIEKLSAYKESKGKSYKSDAGAIRAWVIDEVKKTWRTNNEVVYRWQIYSTQMIY